MSPPRPAIALALSATALVALALDCACGEPRAVARTDASKAGAGAFTLWATGDAHVHTDLRWGRESLAEAIRHSEFGSEAGAPPFDWEVMLHLGDIAGNETRPGEEEGEEAVRQLLSAKLHRREHIYSVAGNHDATDAGEHDDTQWWFRRYVDPTGERTWWSRVHADRRPYPVEGTWERYSFQVGNVLFLMMSDRNDGGPPAGRGPRGGYPAGRVTRDTFDWWVKQVEANPDKIIVSAHHHMLKDTTVASDAWEGVRGWYHGNMEDGAPQGASYLYFLDDEPDAQAFEAYLAEHPGAIDLWLGAHTHTNPDDTYGGKSHIERKWGVTFINVAALARHHVRHWTVPMSRLIHFEPGADEAIVQCYLHTSDYAPQGFYAPAERRIPLRHAFRR